MIQTRLLPASLAVFAIVVAAAAAGGTPRAGTGTVSGLVMDKNANVLKVKLDDAESATDFTIDKSNPKLMKQLQTIFSVARVKMTLKKGGGERELASVERIDTIGPAQINKVTGTIVDTHTWWVEVKPKKGPVEGYACTYPKEVWERTTAAIKQLKKGDNVVVQYYTDGERHRIVSINYAK